MRFISFKRLPLFLATFELLVLLFVELNNNATVVDAMLKGAGGDGGDGGHGDKGDGKKSFGHRAGEKIRKIKDKCKFPLPFLSLLQFVSPRETSRCPVPPP